MYDIFMIDPPWPKKKGGIRKLCPNQTRELDYKTMSVSDIFDTLKKEILNQAATNHCVFLWTIDQFLVESEQEFEKLGYRRHARFVWDKTNGVAPAFTIRYSHEYLIWFYKDKLLPISKEVRGKYKTVLTEKSREHSRKTEIAYQMINDLYPNAKKYDVFSRQKRDGWDQFGDQINHFAEGAE